jgi:hypothetical protein
MKILRTPQPNAHLAELENCDTDKLLWIFDTLLKTGTRRLDSGLLADAWDKLFSDVYLSAEELVDAMQRGEHRLGEDNEHMLHEFIKADCAVGGSFVMKVIKNGGKIDRAALIMIADLEDLASLVDNGMTALHTLVDACDRKVRPALIRKAGKELLQIYDKRGIPLIFSIFSLCDLHRDDLDAIESVFSRDELKNIRSRSGTGNSALYVFNNMSASLKGRSAVERNTFYRPAAKDTDMEKSNVPVKTQTLSAAQVKAELEEKRAARLKTAGLTPRDGAGTESPTNPADTKKI